MMPIFVVLCAWSSSTHHLVARSCEPPADVVPPTTTPVLTIQGDTESNAGLLDLGDSVVTGVTLVNNTSYTCTVRWVRSSCSCLRHTAPSDPIPPCGASRASVQLDALPVSGVQRHAAEFEATFSEGDRIVNTQRFSLSASYQANLALVVKPEAIWVTVVAGKQALRSVYSRSPTLDALDLKPALSDLPIFRWVDRRRAKVPLMSGETNDVFVDRYEVRTDTPGYYKGFLKLQTEHPGVSNKPIPVQVRVLDRWIATPAGFGFLFGRDASIQTITCQIRPREGPMIKIESLRVIDTHGNVIPDSWIQRTVRSDESFALITLSLDPASAPAEGMGTVEAQDIQGTTISRIPLAWVRRQ